jgi:hypothetical protein
MSDKSKPYVDNYPVLRDWLRKNEAKCDWQLSLGSEEEPSAFVESYSVRGRQFLIMVYSNHGGWDIYTSGASSRIDETLDDANKRLARIYK